MITYMSWDYGQKRIYMDGVDARYIPRKGFYIRRKARFIKAVSNEIKNNQYDIHFIKEFKGCSLLKILNPSKTFIFDVRSGAVYQSRGLRIFYDGILKLESRFFKHKTVISRSLADKLKINAYILPLGADVISDIHKTFDAIDLLYVGTLYNRNIAQTIRGFSRFYHAYKGRIKIRYTIIGTGPGKEEEELKKIVCQEKLEDVVTVTGHVPHNQIKPYFDSHNIGVSYIPITEYFDVQPPTKTFEYLLSGMPVIATDTKENRAVITSDNGILITDDEFGFESGLIDLFKCIELFDSEHIRTAAMPHTWEKIIAEFRKYLDTIIEADTHNPT
jgi:glycosyltransferase involved in cell wall biosynthesis